MQLIRKVLNRIRMPADYSAARLSFQCNICGHPANALVKDLEREKPTCMACGSTVRTRALIQLLSLGLFRQGMPLHEFPIRQDLSVLDMSGWDEYGKRLATKFDYINTYYHMEPRMDITDIDPLWKGRFDAVISSDVFEHVIPPVSVAFSNALKLLKPGGILILTVPYTTGAISQEHFPELYDFKILKDNGRYILKNITRDGTKQQFNGLVFHGGPGSTLEMRVFAEDALRENLCDAGFVDIEFRGEPHYDCGVIWHHAWSLPVTARRP